MMLSAISLVLQNAAPRSPMIVPIIYIVSFGLIAWLLLIRPQRKMAQQHQAMIAGLSKGDEVMTDGGIIGTIVHITDDRITIKSGENTRIVVARAKISRVMSGTAPKE